MGNPWCSINQMLTKHATYIVHIYIIPIDSTKIEVKLELNNASLATKTNIRYMEILDLQAHDMLLVMLSRICSAEERSYYTVQPFTLNMLQTNCSGVW